ncbi:STAS/SEC14 domain-containing protein [Rufibacter psychrotolerans]|uniref:STAS/SEC14 domain-containing protein n=1 Tax=Rufibacter psychrotolerans TaxID=2812556 RepID=UPI00196712DB|nr:STAS/SEC14 domain-containing protein [Rufibacter sp. SYSU D00308]
MKKSYFLSGSLELSYDDELSTAYAVWNGFLSSEEFREATQKCIELMEEQGITRWLADNRKMRVIRQADQQWFAETIIPRMLNTSLRRIATLVSEDVFNKMAVEQLMQRANSKEQMTIRDFNQEAAALAWLMAPLSQAAV